jgi:hypothetical protein
MITNVLSEDPQPALGANLQLGQPFPSPCHGLIKPAGIHLGLGSDG